VALNPKAIISGGWSQRWRWWRVFDDVVDVCVDVGCRLRLEINDGHCLVGEERIRAPIEHGGSVAAHNRTRLHMQIAHRGIAMPAPQHSDVIRVHFTTKQRHGASCAQGPSADLVCSNARAMVVERHRMAQYLGDIGRFDWNAAAASVVGRERSGGLAFVLAVAVELSRCRFDWAAQPVATAAVDELLVSPPILLCGEGICDRIGSIHLGRRGCHTVQTAVLYVQGDVLDAEGGVVRCGAGVLPRP
jgi:hypothetical protein